MDEKTYSWLDNAVGPDGQPPLTNKELREALGVFDNYVAVYGSQPGPTILYVQRDDMSLPGLRLSLEELHEVLVERDHELASKVAAVLEAHRNFHACLKVRREG